MTIQAVFCILRSASSRAATFCPFGSERVAEPAIVDFGSLSPPLLLPHIKYLLQPTHEGFEKSKAGDIVVRRVKADIDKVTFKYKNLPTIRLPLKKKGGFLDFLYLDDKGRWFLFPDPEPSRLSLQRFRITSLLNNSANSAFAPLTLVPLVLVVCLLSLVRITRGNRGGVFVHARQSIVDEWKQK